MEKDLIHCGLVFGCKDGYPIFMCSFCKTLFTPYEVFMRHVQETHMSAIREAQPSAVGSNPAVTSAVSPSLGQMAPIPQVNESLGRPIHEAHPILPEAQPLEFVECDAEGEESVEPPPASGF